MRIAIFTDSFWPQVNGVTTSILNMVDTLSQEGHHFLIFAPKPKKFPGDAPLLKNTQIIWLPAEPLPTYTDYLMAYLVPPSAKKIFKEFHADLVHVHTPFFVAQKGIKYAQRAHIPVIGTFHTLVSEFLDYVPIPKIKHNPIMKQLTWVYTQHVYGKCDVITTPTKVLADELHEHGFKNVHVLTNAIDYELFSHGKNAEWGKKINLCYFGRVSFEKRIDVALEALFLLRKKYTSVEMNIIGSGPAEKSLQTLSRELGLEKHVHFLGVKRGKELARAVKQNHLLIAPSPMETQGLYVLEAMAAGLCVVGANARAIPAALGKNERGLLFEANNVEDCAQKIEKVMKNAQRRKKLATNAKKWVKHYSKKSIAREWMALYTKTRAHHP
ncbi:MAG: glycosyltransferase family 4 protein [Candidatus Diapherotrites archaeon]|uniref:Glycosyltransferase family 4 protein n=1 Tax=Candidatus Iainarchaeum sp. TaxID=3101447 RepID=A0A8T4CAC2_9ARCH|nr:glycosyltransferase family 4 protein [Candidatus Diapherotrites archaeon]